MLDWLVVVVCNVWVRLHSGQCVYPHLTAPNSAPSHSFFSVSSVLSGSATPVRLKHSNPASRSTKENLRPREVGRASRMRRPAGMTSRPMPSPGMRPRGIQWLGMVANWVYLPIRSVRAAIGSYLNGQWLRGSSSKKFTGSRVIARRRMHSLCKQPAITDFPSSLTRTM